MNDGWREYRLRDLCEGIYDGPHATPHKTDSGPVFLGISNLSSGRLDLTNAEHLSDIDFPRWTKRVAPREGDIVFSYETRLGEAAHIPGGLRCCLGRRMGLLRPNRQKVNPRFLLYAYLGPVFQDVLRAKTIYGSTVERLLLTELPDFPMSVPSRSVQDAIAGLLGGLDDKIDLNRRTNETLEGIARAIFKSWFVDFDPVRAKAEGRQPVGMDAETAALFPADWAGSSLGRIPAGWSVAEIQRCAARIQYGFTQSAVTEPIGPRFLRITDIQRGRVDWHAVPFCAATPDEHEKYRIRPGDILVARTGASTGENVYIVDAPDAVFASYLVRIQFHHRSIARFVGEHMRTAEYFSYISGVIGGSAQPNASGPVLAGAELIFPPLAVADAFSKTVGPLDSLRYANGEQSRSLAVLRDALLPKLLSGAIRIRDAEKVVEAHV